MGPRGRLFLYSSSHILHKSSQELSRCLVLKPSASKETENNASSRASKQDLYHLAANSQKLPEQVRIFLCAISVCSSAPFSARKAGPHTTWPPYAGPAAEGRGSKPPTSSRSTETSWVAPPRRRKTPHAHFLTGANTNHFVLLRRSGHRPAGRDVRPEAAVTCTSDSSLGERVPKSLAPLQAAVHHATGAGMSLL